MLIYPDDISPATVQHDDFMPPKNPSGYQHELLTTKLEQMDRAELEELQLKRLKSTVESVYKSVPFYHESMLQAGVSPQDIQSLRDLEETRS